MFFQPLSQFEATLYTNNIYFSSVENYLTFSYFIYNFFYNFFFQKYIFSFFFFFPKVYNQSFFIYIFSFIEFFIHVIISRFFIILEFFMNTFIVSENYYVDLFVKNKFEGQWIDTSINKFHTSTIFILLTFFLFFIFCFKNFKYYNLNWNINLFSIFDEFLSTTIIQQLGIKRGQKYSVFLKSFFFIILFSNIFGLIPFSFTITSHLIFTFSLSFSILIGITLLGFSLQGVSFLKLLIPGGAPIFLMPLLIPIEFISYIARCFSLAIRLFANMMSGHTLLNILSGFILKISNNGFLFFSFAPLVIVMAVVILELGIAFLQAYVFLVLVCIYLKDAFEAGH
jgi:F-type H+-transporting ATPase subunit a